jgi:MoaA/NifB/PqqE/SkfB family radical SAM enzyme
MKITKPDSEYMEGLEQVYIKNFDDNSVALTDNQKILLRFLNRGEPPCDYERQLLEKHSERIAAIFSGKIIPPYEVEIQPSSFCNLDCKHCFGKVLTNKKLKDKIGEKEMRIIAERINEFQEEGFKVEVVKFCGTTGEPLINPAIIYGIKLFKDAGKKVIVFTNGLWLDKKYDNREYLYPILEADTLRLSLDAGSEKTFKQLKGVDGFARIINNLRKLIEEKKRKGSKLNVVIGYVIGTKNYQEITKATRLMKLLGADEIRFRVDLTDQEGIRNISQLIIKQLKKARRCQDERFKVISEYSEKEIDKESLFHADGRKCFNQHFWACIGPDGNLYACGHRTYCGIRPYGSLLKNSFKKLWINKERQESLKKLPDECCRFCSPSSLRRNDFMTFLYTILGGNKNGCIKLD